MSNVTVTLTGLARRLVSRDSTPRERYEPHLDSDRARWRLIPTVRRVVLSEWEQRRRPWIAIFVICSLIFHILLVTAVVYYAGRGESQGPAEPIPVQLVMLPPKQPNPEQQKPKPPPEHQPQKNQKPPPRGPLASDELGDPNATGKTPATTHTPEAGQVQREAGEAPPPPSSAPDVEHPSDVARPKPEQDEQKATAPDQEKLPDTPDKLAIGGALQPPPSTPNKPRTEQLAAKAVDRPTDAKLLRVKPGGATRPTERPDENDHDSGHKAKYPGPDASRDEYLAYIRDLTMGQLREIPSALLGAHQGGAVFRVLVRPNGSIVWFASIQSSGDRQIDKVLLTTLNSMANFPPLPGELLSQNGSPTELVFSVPLAALEKNP